MATHNDFGKEAEAKALEFLVQLEFEILATNWFYKKAEIDLIAFKNNTIHIIEVKARSYDDVQNPEDAITQKKKKLLIEAANGYIEENQLSYEVQFDIMSMLKRTEKWEINYIPDAFNSIF